MATEQMHLPMDIPGEIPGRWNDWSAGGRAMYPHVWRIARLERGAVRLCIDLEHLWVDLPDVHEEGGWRISVARWVDGRPDRSPLDMPYSYRRWERAYATRAEAVAEGLRWEAMIRRRTERNT